MIHDALCRTLLEVDIGCPTELTMALYGDSKRQNTDYCGLVRSESR